MFRILIFSFLLFTSLCSISLSCSSHTEDSSTPLPEETLEALPTHTEDPLTPLPEVTLKDLPQQTYHELDISRGAYSIPGHGATDVSLNPIIIWEMANPEKNIVYDFELATDLHFENIIESAYGLTIYGHRPQIILKHNTTYFWRYRETEGEIHGIWHWRAFTTIK